MKALHTLMVERNILERQIAEPCYKCKGVGQITHKTLFADNCDTDEVYAQTIGCHVCDGEGWVCMSCGMNSQHCSCGEKLKEMGVL